MTNFEDLSKGDQIKAEIYSRGNFINGRYKAAQITDLDDLSRFNSKNTFLLEKLNALADIADKIITEAEAEGKDTNDPSILRELGKKINEKGRLKGIWGWFIKK